MEAMASPALRAPGVPCVSPGHRKTVQAQKGDLKTGGMIGLEAVMGIRGIIDHVLPQQHRIDSHRYCL